MTDTDGAQAEKAAVIAEKPTESNYKEATKTDNKEKKGQKNKKKYFKKKEGGSDSHSKKPHEEFKVKKNDDGTVSKRSRMFRPIQYKKKCLYCRKVGHNMSECRMMKGDKGICYNCGNPGHSLRDCKAPSTGLKFATCFICGETGHLSSQCPKNEKGMYPEGGCCRLCGSIYHLKQDCPIKSRKDAEVAKYAVIDREVGKKGAVSGDADVSEMGGGDDDGMPLAKRPKKSGEKSKPKKVEFK